MVGTIENSPPVIHTIPEGASSAALLAFAMVENTHGHCG
jgi:hypothetical protein